MDPQWILNKLERGELILRLRIEKGLRFDYFPHHFSGQLISYTGSGRADQAYGYIQFEIVQDRLNHFQVFAWPMQADAEHEIHEMIKSWHDTWCREEASVVRIGQMHMRHPHDTVPLNNLLVIQHLTLLLGLFYQAQRTHRTKVDNALLRDITYKLNTVVARANEGLYLGWF